ncbi:hypothetical protein GCM10023205_24260 [Yinghuangia aomiensis]|uniref:Uncharacterized protein n=1 Tax=Yinghuangia aomiensis TaxID=676205 RepID=A0ABP9H687_9ACTN
MRISRRCRVAGAEVAHGALSRGSSSLGSSGPRAVGSQAQEQRNPAPVAPASVKYRTGAA